MKEIGIIQIEYSTGGVADSLNRGADQVFQPPLGIVNFITGGVKLTV